MPLADSYPKTFTRDEAPRSFLELCARVMPLLLASPGPWSARLREQYGQASIVSVDLTGVGFFIEFSVPADAPRVDPPNATGGAATVDLEGLEHGSGYLLFVRDGVLSTLEGFSYGGPFPDRPVVVAVRDAKPIAPPSRRAFRSSSR